MPDRTMNNRTTLARLLGPPLQLDQGAPFADIRDARARRALIEIMEEHPAQARELARTLKHLEGLVRGGRRPS